MQISVDHQALQLCEICKQNKFAKLNGCIYCPTMKLNGRQYSWSHHSPKYFDAKLNGSTVICDGLDYILDNWK